MFLERSRCSFPETPSNDSTANNCGNGGPYRENIAVSPSNSLDIVIDPLDENFEDCVRKDYGNSRFNPATGVTVGVIDTGVGPHDDLNVIGCGTKYHVVPPQDYRDVIGHGTFVAGLIGARGMLFPKLRGLAPGVLIRAYKIFRGGIATSMDLTHAINDDMPSVRYSESEHRERLPATLLWKQR